MIFYFNFDLFTICNDKTLFTLQLPTFVFIVNYIFTRHGKDLKAAILGHTLSFVLNGVFISMAIVHFHVRQGLLIALLFPDIIKITVGRPRPDFFYRCFPDGIMNSEMDCTGEFWTVQDGRKSFPSGHSSFSFATMGFLSFYLMGKLKIFSEEGRGKSYRLIVCFFPMIVAMLIGKSLRYYVLSVKLTLKSIHISNFKDHGLPSLERGCRGGIIIRCSYCLHVLPTVFPAHYM